MGASRAREGPLSWRRVAKGLTAAAHHSSGRGAFASTAAACFFHRAMVALPEAHSAQGGNRTVNRPCHASSA